MKSEMNLDEYHTWLAQQRRPAPRDDREHQEQCALMEWAALNEVRLPELKLLFAIPNGSLRHPAVAAKLKQEGVRAGVWDIHLPCPRPPFAGLWLEMKAKGNDLTPAQSDWMLAMIAQGYACHKCYDWMTAARRIVAYLDGDPQEHGL